MGVSVFFVWLQFLVCAATIGFAGYKLSRYGDMIEEKTNLGGTLIGLVLLATVTSLPELMTGISSVTYANAPDIAVGDLLGACVLNLTMLVLLDVFGRGEAIYGHAQREIVVSAVFGILLVGYVGFSLLLESQHSARLPSSRLASPSSLVILLLYGLALRTIYRSRMETELPDAANCRRYTSVTLWQVGVRYAVASLFVVAAGAWLPFIGERMAQTMGWSNTFTGSLFVSMATTLPEMAVTIAALRIGAVAMAVGNLFGSNLFNMVILAIDDLFYAHSPLLAHVSLAHLASAFSVVIMSAVAIVNLLYSPPSRHLKSLHWASGVLFVLYLLNTYALYLFGR